MASIKAVIDSRQSKKGYKILIRIQHTSNKKEDISLNEYLPKIEFFDKQKGIVKKRKSVDYIRINNLITEKIHYYQNNINSTTPIKTKSDVLNEFEITIKNLDIDGKYNSKRIFNYTYKFLVNYLESINKTTLDIGEIDDIFVDNFKYFLIKHGLKSTTVKMYLDKLRKVHNVIVKRLRINKINPFVDIKIDKDNNKKLNLDEKFLNNFIQYIPTSKERIYYKNIFLMQFFLYGTRVSDILNLTYSELLIENVDNNDIDKFSTNYDTIDYMLNYDKKIDYSKTKFILEFNAFKTKQLHTVFLCDKAILQMKFFLDKDLQIKFLNECGTFGEKELLKMIEVDIITDKITPVPEKVKVLKSLIIHQSKRTPNKAIFHNWIIPNNIEAKRKFIQSKTSYINKSLTSNEKDEFYQIRVKEHVSSHSARHLFAICFYNKKKDIFGLSKLLFHKNIQTTQIYLKSLNVRLNNEIDAASFYDSL